MTSRCGIKKISLKHGCDLTDGLATSRFALLVNSLHSETKRSSVEILAGECSLYSNYLVQLFLFHSAFYLGTAFHTSFLHYPPGWGCRFFVSKVISEVVFGPFWLMLSGLGPNRSAKVFGWSFHWKLGSPLIDFLAFLVQKLWSRVQTRKLAAVAVMPAWPLHVRKVGQSKEQWWSLGVETRFSSLGLEGFRSLAISLETLHELFLWSLARSSSLNFVGHIKRRGGPYWARVSPVWHMYAAAQQCLSKPSPNTFSLSEKKKSPIRRQWLPAKDLPQL